MTSVMFHRQAVNRCFQTTRPSRVQHKPFHVARPTKHVNYLRAASQEAPLDEQAVDVPLSVIAVEGLEDILDAVAVPEINDVEALKKQISSESDDSVLLAEDEVEAYQDFEAATREVIGLIKDDAQLEVGITEEELFRADVSLEVADVDVAAEFSLSEELAADEYEGLDEDEDELSDVTVAKVLDVVDAIQDKYEVAEAIQDALDAAAVKKPEQNEYDESDAFFADPMPFLEEEVPEYPMPEFKLNFLWMDKNVGVSVDQIYAKGERSPLTEFFWWPRRDAWEDLRANLEARPWISDRDKVILLNRTTEVINFWQDEAEKHTIEQARESFPDCAFTGQDGN